MIGLEPTRLAAPDPKSGTSTNFATPAAIVAANIDIYFKKQNYFTIQFRIVFDAKTLGLFIKFNSLIFEYLYI